jgi:hypothetical protein
MEEKIIGWVARDKSGLLIVGTQKPIKENKFGIWAGFAEHMEINPQLFPQVKWEDEEPTKVELLIKICE